MRGYFLARLGPVRESESGSFDSGRLLSTANDQSMPSALHPFGGCGHRCPGGNFAFAEIWGLGGALIW
jgi:hypothetical protein